MRQLIRFQDLRHMHPGSLISNRNTQGMEVEQPPFTLPNQAFDKGLEKKDSSA